MIKGLSEEDKYKVIRPVIGGCDYDAYGIPIINRTPTDAINWEKLKISGYQNASAKTFNKNTLLLMFNYDKRLLSLWGNPLKKVGLFQSYAAVATPDFSIYPTMNINDIRYNIYMSRWLGKTWQNYGCTVLPTIGWALADTYELCFGNVEPQSVVIISTLGCQEHEDIFLAGFNEMKKRINPPVIIVFGDMIDGMTGSFINFQYKDSFNVKYEQLRFEGLSPIFTIREDI